MFIERRPSTKLKQPFHTALHWWFLFINSLPERLCCCFYLENHTHVEILGNFTFIPVSVFLVSGTKMPYLNLKITIHVRDAVRSKKKTYPSSEHVQVSKPWQQNYPITSLHGTGEKASSWAWDTCTPRVHLAISKSTFKVSIRKEKYIYIFISKYSKI